MSCFPKNSDTTTTVLYTIKEGVVLTEDELDYMDKTLNSVMGELAIKGYLIRNFQDNSCHYS